MIFKEVIVQKIINEFRRVEYPLLQRRSDLMVMLLSLLAYKSLCSIVCFSLPCLPLVELEFWSV